MTAFYIICFHSISASNTQLSLQSTAASSVAKRLLPNVKLIMLSCLINFHSFYCITSKLPVQSWTKKTSLIYSWLLFRCTRMIKPVFGKRHFFMAILKFSDETGSGFFELLDFKIHFHRTWKFAIKILKISQLNLDYLTKNRFSAAFLNFYNLTGSIFF